MAPTCKGRVKNDKPCQKTTRDTSGNCHNHRDHAPSDLRDGSGGGAGNTAARGPSPWKDIPTAEEYCGNRNFPRDRLRENVPDDADGHFIKGWYPNSSEGGESSWYEVHWNWTWSNFIKERKIPEKHQSGQGIYE